MLSKIPQRWRGSTNFLFPKQIVHSSARLLYPWNCCCLISKHSCYWQSSDAWHPLLFKGHKVFPGNLQPPFWETTENSLKTSAFQKEKNWKQGAQGPIPRKAHGFIHWDGCGAALEETLADVEGLQETIQAYHPLLSSMPGQICRWYFLCVINSYIQMWLRKSHNQF